MKENPNFARFEYFHYPSRFLWKLFSASLLAVTKKHIILFRKASLFLKLSQIFKALRVFLISAEVCSKFATFRKNFEKAGIFLEKSIYFWWKNHTLNSSRNFVFSVAFYWILLTFSDFKKVEFFFGKNNCFQKQPNFCTFWEALLSQSFSTANFLRLSFSGSRKNSFFCFERPIYFFWKTQLSRLWKSLLFQAHSATNFLLLTILKKEDFSGKPLFFFEKIQFLNFLKNPISVAFYGNFANFSDFG